MQAPLPSEVSDTVTVKTTGRNDFPYNVFLGPLATDSRASAAAHAWLSQKQVTVPLQQMTKKLWHVELLGVISLKMGKGNPAVNLKDTTSSTLH